MPEQRMSAQLTKLAKKRGRLPALVAALGLLVLQSLQSFLASLVNYFSSLGYIGVDQARGPSDVHVTTVYQFAPSIDELSRVLIPFALGVFVALWILAPISDELTVRFVLTRAGLASLAGSLLVIVVDLILGLVWAFSPTGFDSTEFLQSVVEALSTGLHVFIFTTPLVMFAGLMLWLWLRDHPREYAVAGLIDEL